MTYKFNLAIPGIIMNESLCSSETTMAATLLPRIVAMTKPNPIGMLLKHDDKRNGTIIKQGLLALELSSAVLEIPNDACRTLSQNLIGCSTLSQEYC